MDKSISTLKRHCNSSMDRISELPSNLIEIILMFLPLRDMVRTSVLSSNWRFKWVKVPQLVLNDTSETYTAEMVFGILLSHQGPISKFSLSMSSRRCSYFAMDKIISFLSRNGIQKLTLSMRNKEEWHKLPSSIFSCIELKHLSLKKCVFKPLTFVRFNKLISLELLDVQLDSHVSISSCPLLENLKVVICSASTIDCFSLDAPNLRTLFFQGVTLSIDIRNIPLLEFLQLIGGVEETFSRNTAYDLISLLHSLPLLENLYLDYRFLAVLASGDLVNKIPTMLNNLRMLDLFDIDLGDTDDLVPTLWFIRSSPNLKKIKLSQALNIGGVSVCKSYLKGINYSDYSLLKLQEVEVNWSHLIQDVEFFKFLLAITPELETLHINQRRKEIDVKDYKILLELTRSRRASSKAEIVFGGLDLDVS